MIYDEELKIRSLTIYGFDVDSIDTNKIAYVPMNQYRIATYEHPVLYVDGLQCCIGLYAYGNNFGFAAHINPKVIDNDNYELNNNNIAIRCRRIDDLKNIILNEYHSIEPIKIGTAFGVNPLNEDYPTVRMIYDGIDELIEQLNKIGIKTEKLDRIYAPEFILDTESNEIILSGKRQNQKTR